MIDKSKIKTVIFDYDGTLHNSGKIYTDAFRRVYQKMVILGEAEARDFKDEEITQWLGYSAQDMWDAFMPELSQRKKMVYSAEIGRMMTEKIQNREAVLYDGALETLKDLKKKGYYLLYLSNCGADFMNMHKACFDLGRYFDQMYCSGDYGFRPKYEIFNQIRKEWPGEYLMVGDRFHDMEVAKHHSDVYAGGCLYGFGTRREVEEADVLLQDIRDLQKLL